MAYVFKKHYTRDQARALLPSVREWLLKLNELREESLKHERRLQGLMSPGSDLGGRLVNDYIRSQVAQNAVITEFISRQILIKDLDRGLIDFPAILGGKEVFLCWEKGEEDIEFWHDLDTGFAGRRPIVDRDAPRRLLH